MLSSHVSRAQDHNTGQNPVTPFDRDIIRGIDLLYNWEFEASESLFDRLIEKRPNDPIGYFYSAMVSWSWLASGFWSQKMVDQFGERIDRAISVGRLAVKEKEG